VKQVTALASFFSCRSLRRTSFDCGRSSPISDYRQQIWSLRDNFIMHRTLTLILFLGATAFAQRGPRILISHTSENLRAASAVSRKVAWASGSHGTYLRTVDGQHWTAGQVPGAADLDFRAVVAFSADEAFLMSAGKGNLSRIYHTSDGGQHWALQYTNHNPQGFFDSMAFWDTKHGMVLGDPISDESGKLKFELLTTEDGGQNWRPLASANLPPAQEGEGAFAASNSCLALERDDVWFATGGRLARVFHSSDRGQTWQVVNTPIIHGPESAGIFSIAFRDRMHGVIAGGDYKHPDQDGPNLAFTSDGGKTWELSTIFPQAYFSAAAYDRRQPGPDAYYTERLFIVGPDFIFDFRPPHDPMRISSRRKSSQKFNALSPFPEGGVLVVGPNGSIAVIP
jgi:photosystem II stability/assembly factor-like uncharacterized protein